MLDFGETAASDAAAEVEAYLRSQESKDLLRFITCGSVDDGKSTLIGRLLYDCKLLFEDQLASLDKDSGRFGTTGAGQLDMALLVDGLAAEREQGITIDVAFRFFTTGKRKFIVADTPGHEQYTRNMATGASTAEAAVLLVDARKGILTQTRRHSTIVSLLGIRHVVLAVNKMDLVDWDQETFETIAADYRGFAGKLGIGPVTCIPVSALTGDNIARSSPSIAWYGGPTLLGHLERVEVAPDAQAKPFRFPVQWVNRPLPGGLCGRATRWPFCPAAARRPSRALSRWMATSTRPSRARPLRWCWPIRSMPAGVM
jgi:bifunctional enzyme CysN/CysC